MVAAWGWGAAWGPRRQREVAKRVAAAGSGCSRGRACAAPPECRVGGRQAVVCLDEARVKLQALLSVLHGDERHAQLEVGSRPVAEELDLGTGAATTQAMRWDGMGGAGVTRAHQQAAPAARVHAEEGKRSEGCLRVQSHRIFV